MGRGERTSASTIPTRWTCRCERCAERFGGPIPAELTPEVQAFRQASVVDFLREVVAHVAARGGSNAICLLPATEGVVGMADWDVVAALPGLSMLVTDPYWKHWNEAAGPFVRRFARLLRATADRHGVGAQLWLPSFGLTREDVPELEAAIAAAREEGVDDLWTWGYEACRHMTHLATPDGAARVGGRQRGADRWRQVSAAGGVDMRLGVEAALVHGELVPGDVSGRGRARRRRRSAWRAAWTDRDSRVGRHPDQRLRRRRLPLRDTGGLPERRRGSAAHRSHGLPADLHHLCRGDDGRGAAGAARGRRWSACARRTPRRTVPLPRAARHASGRAPARARRCDCSTGSSTRGP